VDSDQLRRDRVDVWAQVRAVFAACDELEREAKRQLAQHEGAEAGADPARAAKGPPATYSRRRQELRAALISSFRPMLARYAGEQQAAHGLVPLVIAVDERERLALGPLAKRWGLPRLQIELLEIDDGGDRFYDELDAHLEGSGVHPLVFELYLLCLKRGFEGRYQGRQAERQVVINQLVERVRREDPRRALAAASGASVPTETEVADGRRRKVTFVPFPYRYYLGAAALAVMMFVALRIHSNTVVRRSPIGCACSASAQENPQQCLGLHAQ
jgi:type IV/VI secretion system ImpK/VasF family protein